MAEFRLSPRAKADLKLIWRHIADNNEPAADAWLTRILDKLALAADQPMMGALRLELSATARILIDGRYVVIVEPQPDHLLVVAIVHGMRNQPNWLD